MPRILILLALFGPVSLFAQSKVLKKATPSWVIPVDYSTEVKDTLNAGGQYYLLLECQTDLDTHDEYSRAAIRIITEKGIESASSLTVNFDPSYQKLVFHAIKLHRDGTTIDVLKHAQFEVIRRESNMDRLIYDKSLDAILNIEDVQVGDIVEYAYTLQGINPVFEDKGYAYLQLNYSVPMGKIYDRIVCDSKRKLDVRTFNNAEGPEVTTSGGRTTYVIEKTDVPALLVDDYLPGALSPYDRVHLSEYHSWGEVKAWATGIFDTKGLSTPEIDKKVQEIRSSHPTVEAQINATIRFVQDEVRYLSFSDGINSYKPHSPLIVFKQRFGDCKDKSLLLSFMLSRLGVESHPALVNTGYGKLLTERLPMAGVFDHCIAQITFRDSIYWVDPTLGLERGDFRRSTEARYHNALVIGNKAPGLEPIILPQVESRITIEERYSSKMVGGTTHLNVKTVFEGEEANATRDYYKSRSREEIRKNYTNFYANEYADIAMVGYVIFDDDIAANVVTCHEEYEVGNFWVYDSAASKYSADLYARSIAQHLVVPSSKSRTWPLRITYPIDIIQNIIIELPEPWNVASKSESFSSSGFIYKSEVAYVDQQIKLQYRYKALLDQVAVKDVKNHLDNIEKAKNDLSFALSYTTRVAEAKTPFNMPFMLIAIFITPVLAFGYWKLYHYNPRSADYATAYHQIGGWIILPALGLLYAPISILNNIKEADYFNYHYWQVLADPTATSYNPALGLLNLLLYMLSIAILGFYILLIILLIKRRSSFPKLMIIALCANVGYILIQAIWLFAIDQPLDLPEGEAMRYLRPLFSAVIWVPFFLYSDRVKGTFRERL